MKVFITGASSGLGAALARVHAARGDSVTLVARRRDLLEQLASELGDRASVHEADVTDHDALARAAESSIALHGCPDIVIANAGVSGGTLTEERGDIEVFDRIMAINVTGLVATFAPFVAAMKARGSGTLVVIASIAGIRGLPGASAYSASKAAAIAYAEALRIELAPHGIRVVTIAPGFIDTAMTRDNPFPMPFKIDADTFARRAVRAIDRGNRFSVIPWPMAIVAALLRVMPRWLYDAVMKRSPRKLRFKG